MRVRSALTAALLTGACLVSPTRGMGPVALDPMHCMDRLQERIAGCHDYQYDVESYERLGVREERRNYRLFVKDCRLVRIKVTAGRGNGSEAAMTADGKIRGRKGGILKAFDRSLKPDDQRVRSLRGIPFWDAAAHNYLQALRDRMSRPHAQCTVEAASDPPGSLRLVVRQASGDWEQYWIETPEMRVVRGEVFEAGRMVVRYVIRHVRENVGLTEKFFSF
jgi:hypothetical protein